MFNVFACFKVVKVYVGRFDIGTKTSAATLTPNPSPHEASGEGRLS